MEFIINYNNYRSSSQVIVINFGWSNAAASSKQLMKIMIGTWSASNSPLFEWSCNLKKKIGKLKTNSTLNFSRFLFFTTDTARFFIYLHLKWIDGIYFNINNYHLSSSQVIATNFGRRRTKSGWRWWLVLSAVTWSISNSILFESFCNFKK